MRIDAVVDWLVFVGLVLQAGLQGALPQRDVIKFHESRRIPTDN